MGSSPDPSRGERRKTGHDERSIQVKEAVMTEPRERQAEAAADQESEPIQDLDVTATTPTALPPAEASWHIFPTP
jgi:hypothetical protein